MANMSLFAMRKHFGGKLNRVFGCVAGLISIGGFSFRGLMTLLNSNIVRGDIVSRLLAIAVAMVAAEGAAVQ
jgi:hypothetical protein